MHLKNFQTTQLFMLFLSKVAMSQSPDVSFCFSDQITCSIFLCFTIFYYILLYLLYFTIFYYILLYFTIFSMFYHILLCFTIFYYILLYFAIFWYNMVLFYYILLYFTIF